MKFKTLLSAVPALRELGDQRMPVGASLRIARVLIAAQAEIQVYEAKRLKILEALGKMAPDGTKYVFEGDNEKQFAKEYQDLLEAEADLQIKKLFISDLGSAVNKPNDMALLVDFVAEDPEPAPTPAA